MIQAIIFDFDGVILESADIKTEAFRKLFNHYPDHVHAVVDYHMQNMGISRYEKFRHIFTHILKMPLSAELEKELGEKFTNTVFEEILSTEFVPGAYEFLAQNYEKYDFFIASGTPQLELEEIIQRRNISDFFREVHGTPRKKNEIIKDILLRFGFIPKEVVFVGDAISDRLAAENLVNFIARMTKTEQGLADCKYKISNLTELPLILTQVETDRKQVAE